jgi:hypothetical protein
MVSKKSDSHCKNAVSGFLKSDFAGFSPDIAKTACIEAVFKNGARHDANIGMIFLKNAKHWEIK